MPEVLSYLCPFCDSEVRVGESCPGCAKKAARKKPAKKSWEQPKSADGLDLPEDEFDYDDFCKREFGKASHLKTGLKWYWWALAVIVLAGMIVGVFWMR
jgi:hypothetical protein